MLNIVNPATGKSVKEIQEDTPQSVAEKYKLAKTAQKQWKKSPLSERKAAISKFRTLLETHKEDLAQTLTLEVGKPIGQSRNEINGTIGRVDFFLEHFEKTVETEVVFDEQKGMQNGMKETIEHEPLGVVANISAWNYPYFVGSNAFIPALLTGNTVLYKPSEYSSLSGLKIAELLHQSGIPKDAFIAIIGKGEIGSAILDQPINGVFFTGSYPTGKRIAEKVAGKLIKVQLELGGKDPAYICDDANPKNAADSTSDGAFYNNGQSCCSVERIYVHEKVYNEFVEHFMTAVKSFKMGAPTEDSTYLGPLTREAQIAVIEDQIKDAVAKGAKVVCGGNRVKGAGNYFEPTVLVNVNSSMKLMRDESFGPVIGIQSVKDDAEALKLMNDCDYGLTAGVYTPNEARARAILSEVNSGSVYWNCCDRVSPRLPWSGRGFSGIGHTLSTYGIQTFTQPKAWHLRKV